MLLLIFILSHIVLYAYMFLKTYFESHKTFGYMTLKMLFDDYPTIFFVPIFGPLVAIACLIGYLIDMSLIWLEDNKTIRKFFENILNKRF